MGGSGTGFLIGARGPIPQMVADDVGFAWPTKPGAGRLLRHAGAQPHEEHFWRLGGALQMTDMRQTHTTVTDDSVSTRQQGHMPAIPGKCTARSPRCAVQGRRRPRVHRPGAGGLTRAVQ
jgi:hypothetical protein